MAKCEKKHIPPAQHQVTAPRAIAPIMQAFHVNSEEVAHALIAEAAKTIFGNMEPEYDFSIMKRDVSHEELEGIYALMKGINPQDTLETLFAAQIVTSHMLGMRKLSSSCIEDQRLGLNLLRFCSEAMQQLGRKRNGGMQNITVNYNYGGQENALMQTMIPPKEK